MKHFIFISLFICTVLSGYGQEIIDTKCPLVNQAGYNLGESKHFVCYGVSSAIGEEFNVVNTRTNKVEYTGTALGGEGWFTDFNPSSLDEYVIDMGKRGRSVPFVIGDHYMEKISSKLAYDFFIDARGSEDPKNSNEDKVYSGGPTRDCGAFGLESLFEILFYASNPSLFDNWKDELGEKKVADLIDLILWHGEFAYNHIDFNRKVATRHGTLGYPGQKRMEYDYWNTLDQLAPLCAAYHSFLKPYLSEEKYRAYRKACLDKWVEYDRHKVVRYWTYSVKWVDKGFQEFNEMGNVYGQSVFSNLFMYLCERNEPDGKPDQFLKWAQESAEDIIKNWDFNNPRHMWWIRNGEHITPQALAFFLLVAPEYAPVGTKEKLEAWAVYMKQRTNNPWRYRSHSETEMAHPRTKELGGAPALGGSMFAVSYLTGDTYLRSLGWAQVDFVFGANPCGAHFSHKSPERVERNGYWEGVEHGWIASHPNGFGKLGNVRGTLDGTPLNNQFPEMRTESSTIDGKSDDIGVAPYATEGWGISNRGWMATLTFSTLATNKIEIIDIDGRKIDTAKHGDKIMIELCAALNQNYKKIDKGSIDMKLDGGEPIKIEVLETEANSGLFRGVYIVPQKVKSLTASYGYFGFDKSRTISILQ